MNTEQKLKILILILAVFLVLASAFIYLNPLNPQNLPNSPNFSKSPDLPDNPDNTGRQLAIFSLNPSKLTVNSGNKFNLTIKLKAPFSLVGADAVLSFDTEKLAVAKITAGDKFSLYPRLFYDNNKGKIIITGINPDSSDLLGAGAFAVLTFIAKAPGQTQITFDFAPNSTIGSTAINKQSAKNILTHTQNAKIKIK